MVGSMGYTYFMAARYEFLAIALQDLLLQASNHFEIGTNLFEFHEHDGTNKMVVIHKLRECLVKGP